MKILKFGSYAVARVKEMPDGRFRHELRLINAPGRTHAAAGKHTVIYRKQPLTARSKPVRKLETIYIGQLLVSMCRKAMADGEVTKDQMSTMTEIGTEIYGAGWVYRSREGQHAAVERLFRLTGNPDHYHNDVRLTL